MLVGWAMAYPTHAAADSAASVLSSALAGDDECYGEQCSLELLQVNGKVQQHDQLSQTGAVEKAADTEAWQQPSVCGSGKGCSRNSDCNAGWSGSEICCNGACTNLKCPCVSM